MRNLPCPVVGCEDTLCSSANEQAFSHHKTHAGGYIFSRVVTVCVVHCVSVHCVLCTLQDSDLYDEELVRAKLEDLKRRRLNGGVEEIVFALRADLLRNLGNICNPELHKGRLQVREKVGLKAGCAS